ncbi:MAG: peptidase M19 [Flavobacteriaceae bacterium]|nr:MAG: peptidase M19 [Flavobacteriaceae bacterium]
MKKYHHPKYFLLIIFSSIIMIGCSSIIFDRLIMGTTIDKPYKISDGALAFHQSLDFVADLHSDALMSQRNLTKESDVAHVDLPRMRKGNAAFQVFTITSCSPPFQLSSGTGLSFDANKSKFVNQMGVYSFMNLEGPQLWGNMYNRSIWQMDKLAKYAKEDPYFHLIKSKKDFLELIELRSKDKRHIGGILGIEGIHNLKGDIKNLETFYQKGVRSIGFAHFFDNMYAGSRHGKDKYGLTEKGREVLKRMDELGIIADLSHDSEKTIEDVLKYGKNPPIITHGGSRGVEDTPRNFTDAQLKAVAQKGGIIGVMFFDSTDRHAITVDKIVQNILYIRNLVGSQHIALGSDYDGGTITPFDISGLGILTEALLNAGIPKEEIKGIMGENYKNFLLKYLK